MIKTLVTNREWGKFSHTQVASAVKACLGRTEVAKRLLFITFAVVASFVGQTAHAQNAAWDATTTPSAANGKEVYLYNVGTKQFLGRGGRWGTEANMNVEGTMFTLTYNSSKNTFTLTSPMHSDHGSQLTLMDGNISVHDEGNYFLDQKGSAFTVTEVKSGTEVKGYKISSVAENSGGNGLVVQGKTYYMVASGVYQKAYAAEVVNADAIDNATWIIVTHQQRKDAFEKVNNAHEAAVNATFLMSDFDFARYDTNCLYWKTGATATGTNTSTLEMGNDKNYKPSDAYVKTYVYKTEKHVYSSSLGGYLTSEHEDVIESETPLHNVTEVGGTFTQTCSQNSSHTGSYKNKTYTYTLTEIRETGGYTYYLGNGYDEAKYTTDPITGETLPRKMHLQEPYGGAWTANIHGARGTVVQTIPAWNMIKEGWYRISCLGFTTTTKGIARLFAASAKGNTSGSATAQSKKFATADLARIDADKQPKTYVAASQLLDESTEGAYDASVMVYVGGNKTDGFETLSFGIQVGSAADPTQDADATAWTCFDNFKIEYLGTPPHTLILDEDQTDAGYIKAQAPELNENETLQKSEVYLHRTMNPGKWNSLVLPINLTVGQVMRIFGNQVRVSKFVGAKADHPQRIVFEPITADQNNAAAIAIEAGKLYLVKPTADGGMLKDQEVQTFNDNDGRYNISVKDYYHIVGVTFKKKSEIADNAYSGRVMGTTGNEDFDTKQQVQFVGTYVKCFDNDLIPANSYVLNGNNKGGTAGLWYYRTKPTKTKGFRGWLQPANGQSAKGIEYEIEGVVDQVNGDATAIDGIEAEQQHNANIYNLNGQLVRQGATSTEGLPSGLYIVGGKKVVVK